MRKNNSAGFTLIELLVVVGLIGLMAAIVMVALTDSRKKGADAAIKSNLDTIKAQSELFASDNNNSFLPAGGSVMNISTCDSGGNNMLSLDPVIYEAVVAAMDIGYGSACFNSSSAWAVSIQLKTGGTAGDSVPDSWCVDSSGASKAYAWGAGETINNSINVNACR